MRIRMHDDLPADAYCSFAHIRIAASYILFRKSETIRQDNTNTNICVHTRTTYEKRAGRLLDNFLVASLDAAFAFSHVDDMP